MRFKDTLGISIALKHAENLMRNCIDRELQKLDLTFAQYSALSALEEKGSLTNADLARKLHITPQTMIKILEPLSEAKLVTRAPHEENLTKLTYNLTKKAEDLICKGHALVNKIEKDSIKGISKSDYADLQQKFEHILQNLRKMNRG